MGQQPVKKSHAGNKSDQDTKNQKLPGHRNSGMNWWFWVENPIAVIAFFVGGIFLSPITGFPGGNPKHLWYVAIGICILLSVFVLWVFSSIINNLEAANETATVSDAPTSTLPAAPVVQVQPAGTGDKAAAKKPAASTPKDDAAGVPNTPQSAQPAAVADAIPDNSHETPPAATDVGDRPLHEHPTPEYIKRILSNKSGEARDYAKKRFIGMRVSWEGRFVSIQVAGKAASILAMSGLKDEVAHSPAFFSADVVSREHEFLLLLDEDTPIRVDGTIELIDYDIPLLKIVDAQVLPALP